MEITLKEVAQLANGYVEGDDSLKVSSFAKIEDAAAGSITFLANPKYTHYIYDTHATCVIVSESFVPEKKLDVALLRVKDPYKTLADLMSIAEAASAVSVPEGIEEPARVPEGFELKDGVYVGSFAYVGDGVRIGKGTKVYPQVYLGKDVEIGEDCILYPGVKVYHGCRIGNRCIIQAGAVIGSDGFGFAPSPEGFKKIPQLGRVEIADDVEIGANTTIDRSTLGATKIGCGTKLDNLIQVAHNVVIGKNNVFASQTGIAGSARIGDCNMVGGQVGFAGHITVGDRNQIGAQSGIPNDVGDGCRLIGYPAVDARQFAKNAVYLKNLGKLFKTIEKINDKI